MVRVDVQPLYDKLCPEWNLPDAAEKPATRLGVRSLVPEAVYAPGEPITFLVAMIENNQYRSGVGLKCRMIRDYHEPVEFPLGDAGYPGRSQHRTRTPRIRAAGSDPRRAFRRRPELESSRKRSPPCRTSPASTPSGAPTADGSIWCSRASSSAK